MHSPWAAWAEHMAAFEARYGDGCEIGGVCSVVETLGPLGPTVRVCSSDPSSRVTVGLLRVAEATMLEACRADEPSRQHRKLLLHSQQMGEMHAVAAANRDTGD